LKKKSIRKENKTFEKKFFFKGFFMAVDEVTLKDCSVFLDFSRKFFYFINISHFSSIMKATNDESVHIAILWTLKWRVRSCSYNRQSPIFFGKERGIWFSF